MFVYLSHTHFDLKILLPIMILLFIAAVIPVILSSFKIKMIPVLVVEIICGIVIGSFSSKEMFVIDGSLSPIMEGIYIIGMGVLLFLSGLDTDFSVLKKIQKNENKIHINALTNILLICVILLSFGISFLFMKYMNNKTIGIILLTIIFSSTFASIVIPLIHEDNLHHTTIGKIISAYSSKSELLSIIALSILMVVEGVLIENSAYTWLLIAVIVILVLVYIFDKYLKLERFKKISGGIVHFSVRFTVAILLGLMILCSMAGVEYILGSFLAGMVIKLAKTSKETIYKLETIGYGIFVPMFYILVGIKVGANMPLFEIVKWENLSLIMLLLFALILVKIPFMYLLKWFKLSTVVQTTIFIACTLIVAITAEEFGVFDEKFINALIVASCFTCIISPIVFDITKNYGFGKNENDTRIVNPNK